MFHRMDIRLVIRVAFAFLVVSSQASGGGNVPPGLPEGNGIAANHPGDAGIEGDPAVVFADGFERTPSGLLADGFHWEGETKWDDTWGGCLIVEESENVHAGRKALQMTIERPGTGEPGGVGIQKYLEEGCDTLFLRFYAKFEKSTEVYHGGAHNGGGINARAPGVPQGCPGVRADGSNKFDVYLDTWRPRQEIPSPGHLVLYVYHMEQGGRWGDQFFPSGRVNPSPDRELFGEGFAPRPDLIPERDRWYCYELMVRANTPGRRDGRAAEGVLLAPCLQPGPAHGLDGFTCLMLPDVPSIRSHEVALAELVQYLGAQGQGQRVGLDQVNPVDHHPVVRSRLAVLPLPLLRHEPVLTNRDVEPVLAVRAFRCTERILVADAAGRLDREDEPTGVPLIVRVAIGRPILAILREMGGTERQAVLPNHLIGRHNRLGDEVAGVLTPTPPAPRRSSALGRGRRDSTAAGLRKFSRGSTSLRMLPRSLRAGSACQDDRHEARGACNTDGHSTLPHSAQRSDQRGHGGPDRHPEPPNEHGLPSLW